MPTTPFPLGRNKEHDPKSRGYAHPVMRIGRLSSVTHTLAAPHLNQDELSSCEGNTAAEFLNCAKAINNRRAFWRGPGLPPTKGFDYRKYLQEINAVTLYEKATALDDDGIPGIYPPEDTGTSGVGIAKAMQKTTAIDRYNWTFTFDAFRSTLQTQPIMLGTNWYDEMFDDPKNHPIGLIDGPSSTANPAGGHAYLAFAWRPKGKYVARVGCTNHWVLDDGSPWGIKIGDHQGCFWIDEDLLEELLIHNEGESLVPVLK